MYWDAHDKENSQKLLTDKLEPAQRDDKSN